MCGIAGIVSLDGFEPGVLEEMTHLVSYRGPSGFGFAYACGDVRKPVCVVHNENRRPQMSRALVGLGSRRLAILDTSALGTQPMVSADGSCCITFNGEIYNYKEIRDELRVAGHEFRTGTDTEVILAAYKEWGEDCLSRFNGMWSFALWDKNAGQLFCARDRFGIKPFYYALKDGRFYFGSEIKQVLLASELSRRANATVVYNFLEFGLVDYSADTFFEGVQQLQGGHTLVLKLTDPLSLQVRRYWELEIDPDPATKQRDAVQEFRERFENSVKIRLRSDVPVGFSLSGGLDSSAIACEAKRISPSSNFQAFSACFDDEAFDERDYMMEILTATRSDGHRTFPRAASFWSTVKKILFHQDEPLGSTGAFAQWCVMAEAREKGVPVVLGGQGGDEILCGYQKYRYFYLWHLLRGGNPRFVRESLLFSRNGTRSHWTFGSVTRYLPTAMRRRFSLTERVCQPDFCEESRDLRSGLGATTSVSERQKADLTYASIPAMLHSEDRNSMAHSVESRLPFLDYKLVEFAVNCPASLKMHDGWSKWLLRVALEGTLPDKIRLRKTKLGFSTPEPEWIRQGLQNGHRKEWDTATPRLGRFISTPALSAECDKFLRGVPHALPANWLFRAIELELWAGVHDVS
ncbi:MAG: asparagine synthase (glutamine-hydrolyzing) [Candidatus Acidiferrales bacterium]|jgi:asparagine synthase (glutamine-hydrolysing)